MSDDQPDNSIPKLDEHANIPRLTEHADPVPASPAPAQSAAPTLPDASDTDLRAALEIETPFIVDRLLDEMMPRIEARLREHLLERSREILKNLP